MTTPSNDTIAQAYLSECRRRLAACNEKIQHCLGQLSDDQLCWRPHESHHSIANIVLHLCGNLRQWIVAGVTNAEDVRNRPEEFAERGSIPRADLIRRLNEIVKEADRILDRVTAAQLLETRRIQGFDETVLSASADSLFHLAGHTQEIVYITRLQLGDAYRFHWQPTTPEQGAPVARND